VIQISDPVKFLNERRFTVLWSGGKDSTAALLWVLDNVKHDDWNILFVEVTGNTHPLNIQYVYETAKTLGVLNKLIHAKRTDMDFFTAMKRWGIPIIGYSRWCLLAFKEEMFKRYSYFTEVTGIRRTDSKRRSRIGLVEYYRKTNNIAVNVIYNWSREKVLKYIRDHGVEINPCYQIYGHSGNCMYCPYHRYEYIVRTLRDPEWGPKIIETLQYVAENIRMGSISRQKYEKWMKAWRVINGPTLDKWYSHGSAVP